MPAASRRQPSHREGGCRRTGERLRQRGLRPVSIWAPDVRDELRREIWTVIVAGSCAGKLRPCRHRPGRQGLTRPVPSSFAPHRRPRRRAFVSFGVDPRPERPAIPLSAHGRQDHHSAEIHIRSESRSTQRRGYSAAQPRDYRLPRACFLAESWTSHTGEKKRRLIGAQGSLDTRPFGPLYAASAKPSIL